MGKFVTTYKVYFHVYLGPEDDKGLENASSGVSLAKISASIRREFPSIVTEQLLNAIRMNSYEARQRFPRLLQIVSIYRDSHIIDEFIAHSRSIPCWMFLGWLSQMTPLLDKPEARAVHHILESICVEYPQAFVYAFKMTLEQIGGRERREFVDKLKSRMSGYMQIENQFVKALEQLASTPHIMFKVRLLFAIVLEK